MKLQPISYHESPLLGFNRYYLGISPPLSAYTYLFSANTIEGVRELGFPDFFRVELAILKVIAAILLLIPKLPLMVKDWTYAGTGLFLITAVVAHLAHKDSPLLLVVVGVLMLQQSRAIALTPLHQMAKLA